MSASEIPAGLEASEIPAGLDGTRSTRSPAARTLPRPAARSLRLRNPLVPAIVVLLAALQLIIPYRGWSALLLAFGGLWLLTYLWSRSLLHGLALQRETRFGWQQVGDTMLERFTLINNGWAPAVWLELADHSTMPGLSGIRVTRISGHSSHRRHTEVVCSRRGLFTLGPTTLHSGDPFGVYAVEVHNPATVSLLVMPPIVPLPRIQIAAGGALEEGPSRDSTLVRSVSSGRIAPYRPGDSLRWIHWPSSARREALYVRVFDTSSAGHWWIVVDLDRSVQVGQGQDSTVEHAIILAASLADQAIRAGRSVGLLTQRGGSGWAWVAPRSGPTQRWAILRALTLADPGPGRLAEVLSNMPRGNQHRASLVVITPSTQQDWIAPLFSQIQAGAVPTVLLLDPATFGGDGLLTPALERLSAAAIRHFSVSRQLLDLPEPADDPWKRNRPGEPAWQVVG